MSSFISVYEHARMMNVLEKRIAELEAEYERLLILATKWCDKDHHDWQEILKIGDKS